MGAVSTEHSEIAACEKDGGPDTCQFFFLLLLSVAAAPLMGWQRLVGSLNIEVSFVKEAYKNRIFLRERPTISESLLIVAIATQYTW